MSDQSNVMPSVEEPSAGVVTANEENAPSTSQGRQQLEQDVAAASGSGSGSVGGRMESATSTMTQQNGPVMRIKRELSDITQNPPPNCSAELYKEDLFHWKATVIGPSGTVYEGGIFKLDIRLPGAYPFRPPQIRFMTRIYHCNVDSRGAICLDVLNERWSPVMNIAKVLLSIWVLIGECNPHDPLVMGIAEQYKTNRKEHDKIARYWTKRFAMNRTKSSSKSEQELQLLSPDQQAELGQEQQPEEQGQEQQPEEQQQEGQQQEEQQQPLEEQPLEDQQPTTSSSIAVNVIQSRKKL